MSRPRPSLLLVLALVLGGLVFGAAALAAGGGSGAAPRATVPLGPRLSFLEGWVPTKEAEPGTAAAKNQLEDAARVITVDPGGHDRRPFPTPGLAVVGLGVASWSAASEEVAFLAEPAREARPHGDQTRLRIYVADADGSRLRPVPDTVGASHPILSPDGNWIAFSLTRERMPEIDPKNPKSIIPGLEHSYAGSTVWIAPVTGGEARRLTGWQNGRWADPSSFSPDGLLLAVTISPPHEAEEVDTVELATGKLRTVEVEAGEAAFSPDGSRIAFTSYRDRGSVPGFDEPEGTTELYVANADGTGARRLTHTPERSEATPSWDPSGERLGYLRTPGGMLEFLGVKGEVMESNADGTCPTAIAKPLKRPGTKGDSVQAPTWLPGEDRGVGPISC